MLIVIMTHCKHTRKTRNSLLAAVGSLGVAFGAAMMACAPTANSDAVAYLVNVTVRPGYNFANAEAALAYGHGICDKIRSGVGFPQLMAEVKHDFGTADEYQASYLISQAAQELCPGFIWNLRNSAASYVPPLR
jgi:hypothetical protein